MPGSEPESRADVRLGVERVLYLVAGAFAGGRHRIIIGDRSSARDFWGHRRKWATERKHRALADVAEARGCLSTVTLATCYQQLANDCCSPS